MEQSRNYREYLVMDSFTATVSGSGSMVVRVVPGSIITWYSVSQVAESATTYLALQIPGTSVWGGTPFVFRDRWNVFPSTTPQDKKDMLRIPVHCDSFSFNGYCQGGATAQFYVSVAILEPISVGSKLTPKSL